MPIHFKYLITWRKKNVFFKNSLNDIFFKNTTFIWRSFKHILNKTHYVPEKNIQNIQNIQNSMYYPNYHMFNRKLEIKNDNKIYYKRCGTIIIITKNNIKYLVVVKGYGGKWSLPKGKPNIKETDEDCAIRETYEETNIKLNCLSNCDKIKFGKNIYFIYYMPEHIFNEQNLYSNDKNEVEIVDVIDVENVFLLDCNKDLTSLTKIINKL